MHPTRLNRRELINGGRAEFGSPGYAKEELVAELGAAFLLAEAGLESEPTGQNRIAYLQSWIEVLGQNPLLIGEAAPVSRRAVGYILGEELPGQKQPQGQLAEEAGPVPA